jgi:hypothetical protein
MGLDSPTVEAEQLIMWYGIKIIVGMNIMELQLKT